MKGLVPVSTRQGEQRGILELLLSFLCAVCVSPHRSTQGYWCFSVDRDFGGLYEERTSVFGIDGTHRVSLLL